MISYLGLFVSGWGTVGRHFSPWQSATEFKLCNGRFEALDIRYVPTHLVGVPLPTVDIKPQADKSFDCGTSHHLDVGQIPGKRRLCVHEA